MSVTQKTLEKIRQQILAVPHVEGVTVEIVTYILVKTEVRSDEANGRSAYKSVQPVYNAEQQILQKYPNLRFRFEVDDLARQSQ